MKNKSFFVFAFIFSVIFASCGNHPSLPSSFTKTDVLPKIFPDYTNVVVPKNIAPLNFLINDGEVEDCVAQFKYNGNTILLGDNDKVIIDEDDWRQMLLVSVGKSIEVTIYSKKKGKWIRYLPFQIIVASDSIDLYITYRLVPPSYTLYDRLSLCQRCLENFDEVQIYNNQMLESMEGGQCINCHSSQNYKTDRTQFHVRAEYGGTIIFDKGILKKIDLKRDGTISAGVYPAWHPIENLIAYSMNKTMQNFHTSYMGKVEVQDTQGGMLLYDVEHDKVSIVSNDADHLLAFPTWSPDGKYLYYASAHFVYSDSIKKNDSGNIDIMMQHEVVDRYKDVKYDIVRRPFNIQNYTFGAEEMIFEASRYGMSATVPRISPDGRYLLLGLGNYGCFHIWHPESDLYVFDLHSYKYYPLNAANSPFAESFHNFSSNGRWIIFESRRDDNNYTRLYISYFDKEGRAYKAFELPQQYPDYEQLNLNSYNVPEFTIEKVKTTPQDLAKVVSDMY